jgi:methyl-accepting chemotaxis protein
MTLLTEGWLEKYVKKLVGRTEMEDALKKLDKLTQEEARMAAAQNLKATHAVDERVKGVVDTVEAIDNKMVRANDLVAGVNDRVADVDNRVADVNDRVVVVNDRVAAVDDQVASVNERVVTVDDRVKVVDSNLMQVIAGA